MPGQNGHHGAENIFKFVLFSVKYVPDCAINSSPPGATYMHYQQIDSALVQIITCPLFSTKPLTKPMLGYCLLDPWEQTLLKFESKYKHFYSRKCIWKYCLQNAGHFVPGRDAFNIVVSLVQVMVWYQQDAEPFPESVMTQISDAIFCH